MSVISTVYGWKCEGCGVERRGATEVWRECTCGNEKSVTIHAGIDGPVRLIVAPLPTQPDGNQNYSNIDHFEQAKIVSDFLSDNTSVSTVYEVIRVLARRHGFTVKEPK